MVVELGAAWPMASDDPPPITATWCFVSTLVISTHRPGAWTASISPRTDVLTPCARRHNSPVLRSPSSPHLLEEIDQAYDLIPVAAGSEVSHARGFSVFCGRDGAPSYVRPIVGCDVEGVDEALSHLRHEGLEESVEWIDQRAPGLDVVVAALGFTVHRYPLMILTADLLSPDASVADIVDLDPHEPDFADLLAASHAVAEIAFGGTVGGIEERDAFVEQDHDAPRRADWVRPLIATKNRGDVVATTHQGVVARSSWQAGGTWAELVGVATLPSHAGRGLARAVSARAASSARASGRAVFLTAADERVEALYCRLGFERVGVSCVAERP